jgi:hypothetical protein
VRALVATLYTCENEFDECLAAIGRQTFKDYEHLIIRNLTKKQAHQQLYGTFKDRSDEFDLLIKVDADMVIEDDRLFESLVDQFKQHDGLQLFTIYIRDFFPDQMVSGLHTFRNTANFPKIDKVYTDKHAVPADKMLIDRTQLGQRVIHCKNPSSLQAFHYGLHRGVKLAEHIRRGELGMVYPYAMINERIWRHFCKTQDTRIGLACLGGELAIRDQFSIEHVDYENPRAQQELEKYEAMDASTLGREIRSLRGGFWSAFPASWRAEAKCGRPLSLPFRCMMPWSLRRLTKAYALSGFRRICRGQSTNRDRNPT